MLLRVITLFVLSATAFAADLLTPQSKALTDSSLPIPGISIPNTHYVGKGAAETKVIRGAQPASFVSDLKKLGVTDVLIFKRQTGTEVHQEIKALTQPNFGFRKVDTQQNLTPGKHVYHVPALWRGIQNYQLACEQLLDALRVLLQAERNPDRRIFFHCTSGEDRTGLLAGLYKMVNEGWTKEQAFSNEMCNRGYEQGNPDKEEPVVAAIRKELTPLFLVLARKIEKGEITIDSLIKSPASAIAACKGIQVVQGAPKPGEGFLCRE